MQLILQESNNKIGVTSTLWANTQLLIVPYVKVQLFLYYNGTQVYTNSWTSGFVNIPNEFSSIDFGHTSWKNGIYTIKYRSHNASQVDEGSIFIDVDIKDSLLEQGYEASVLHYTLVANAGTCETNKMVAIYEKLISYQDGSCNC